MARILVLDDDKPFLDTLVEMLALHGHEVHSALNGRLSLDLISEKKIELMITDLVMPEQEGLQTILEARKFHPELKIIAMSGGGRRVPVDFLEIARKIGADHALNKPFSTEELNAAVNKVMGNGKKS